MAGFQIRYYIWKAWDETNAEDSKPSVTTTPRITSSAASFAAGGSSSARKPFAVGIACKASSKRIYNIGNNRSVEVPRVVALLEQEFGRKAKVELASMQPGDVPETCADVDDLMGDVGFRPATSIEDGVQKFVSWYRQYHRR